MIPGSTLKGVFRSGLGKDVLGEHVLTLLGTADFGGRVTFFDAKQKAAAPVTNHDRYWLGSRGTYVQPNVGIDPHLGSADAGLLFFTEFVPAGADFEVELVAENLLDDELAALRACLAAVFREGGAKIGAGTANGWGAVTWKETRVEQVDRSGLEEWLSKPSEPIPFKKYEKAFSPTKIVEPATISITITLQFQGRMVVNDPTQERKMQPGDQAGANVVGKAPIRRGDGIVYLPAESIRGAFAWTGEEDLADGEVGERKFEPDGKAG